MAFTCEAGDHDDRGVGEFFCVCNQFITVIFHRRFREVPVLGGDGDRCPVRGKGGVEVDQLLVYLKPGIPDAVDEAHFFIQIIDAAGACPAIHRVRGAPSEEVELFGVLQRENIFILQQHEALFRNLQCDSRCLLGKLIRDFGGGRCAADEIQQSGHGPGADKIDNENDCQQGCQPGLSADEFLLCFGEFLHSNADNDSSDKSCADGDEVRDKPLQNADQVFHFKRDHGVFLSLSGFSGIL